MTREYTPQEKMKYPKAYLGEMLARLFKKIWSKLKK